jgi:hypothetical protein
VRALRDPLQVAEKLRQRIVAKSGDGAQIVFVDFRGRLDCCTVGNRRHQALETHVDFHRRVAGVFDAQVSAELLAASLRELAA